MTDLVHGGDATPLGSLPLGDSPDRGDVRRWVRSTCSRLDVHTLVDVLLVTTELVDNAYRHTGSPSELRLSRSGLGILVEVADGDEHHPAEFPRSDQALAGRGVQVMVELATSWGVRVEGAGKVVWAVLPVVEPEPVPRSG
ncbi:MAG TPA: ATP-binding protein [Umezawaea sp.]|nr:ATP-binding protein [Umezawaea sp.]